MDNYMEKVLKQRFVLLEFVFLENLPVSKDSKPNIARI